MAFGVKLGGYQDCSFHFGSGGKHHDSGLAGFGTENRLPLVPSVLDSDTASGTAPHSLESLADVGRKTEVKNIQAIHECPRKPLILQYREERSQEIPKTECLNGTRWIILTKEYQVKYRESRLYECGHLNLSLVKRPVNKQDRENYNRPVMSEFSSMKSKLKTLNVGKKPELPVKSKPVRIVANTILIKEI